MNSTIQFLGHSTFRLNLNNKHILIDPFITDNPQMPSSITADNIEADYILITHGHADHFGDTLEIAKRTNAVVLCVYEMGHWIQSKQAITIEYLNISGTINLPFGKVKMTPALHGSAMPDGTYAGLACGFHLFTEHGSFYFAGDTGLFGDMKLIGEDGIDYAFIPIGDRYTMGFNDAIKAVKLLNTKFVIPIHYNTWDQIPQDAEAWKVEVENQTSAKVILINPADKITF